MPKIVKANPNNKTEKQVKLGDLKPGDVFRDPHASYEEALVEKNGETFYMIINTQPEKATRATVISVDGELVREMDKDRWVVAHSTTLSVGEAEKV